MSQDYHLYEKIDMTDQNLPIIFHRDLLCDRNNNSSFSSHWHEKIELLYFISGEAVIQCNSETFCAGKGDLIVINSNELHQGRRISEEAEYYCIIFDTSLFQSLSSDICQAKYITPISENRILFENKVENDPLVAEYISRFVEEYELKKIGYEMAVKAAIYQLIVFLLRNHVKVTLSCREYYARMKNLQRFNVVIKYIESHYNEKITIDALCRMANLSRYYFCREFREITGKSLGQYINLLRISKAETLLSSGNVNITEAAMACGFDDANYFSRVFKKYRKRPPSDFVKDAKKGPLVNGNN